MVRVGMLSAALLLAVVNVTPAAGHIGSAQAEHARAERAAAGPPGGAFKPVPGIGPARRSANGGLEVRLRDGSIVPTHGTDVRSGESVASNGDTTYPSFGTLHQPSCTLATGRFELVYMHAAGVSSSYSAHVAGMRSAFARANTWFRETAVAQTGNATAARLRTVCNADGSVHVSNAGGSAWSAADADFSRVRSELAGRGYSDPNKKYVVLFDTGANCKPAPGSPPGWCSTGVGSWPADTSRTPTNAANQPYSTSYASMALVWGARFFYQDNTTTMLHEVLHTMGAVNNAAPWSTGAGHCWDDLDPMCYADGGTNPPGAVQTRCATGTLDCGGDSYYNVANPGGTWVGNNWQVGWEGNRFMSFTMPPNEYHVTYRDANANVINSWYGHNSGWKTQPVPVGPQAAGDVSTSHYNNEFHVVYRNANAALTQNVMNTWYRPGVGWTAQTVPTGPRAATDVSTTSFNNEFHVVYRDATANLIDAYYAPGTGWTYRVVTVGPQGTGAVSATSYNNELHLVYRDLAGNVINTWYTVGGGWTSQTVPVGPAAASDVSVAPYNDELHFAYRSASGRPINTWYKPSTGWSSEPVAIGPAVADDVSVTAYSHELHFVYRQAGSGSTATVINTWYKPGAGWFSENLPAGPAASGDPGAMATAE